MSNDQADHGIVSLSLNGASPASQNGSGAKPTTHAATRIVCYQDAYVLELASGRRASYPRYAVEEVNIDDEVDLVRAGNPA